MPTATIKDYSLSAAILAGGSSTRMGRDKALAPFGKSGEPLIARAIAALRPIFKDISIIGDTRPELAHYGVVTLPDDMPGQGVLGGISTALRHAKYPGCLVVSCDMPFLNARFLRFMVELPRGYDVLSPRVSGQSRQRDAFIYQTMHSIYNRGTLPVIERQIAGGNLQVVSIFPALDVHVIDEVTIRAFDPDLHMFFSANSPALLQEAELILQRSCGIQQTPDEPPDLV